MTGAEIIFFIVVIGLGLFFAIYKHMKTVKNETMLAEQKVRDFLIAKGFNITKIISKQCDVKIKGVHIGSKVKAYVADQAANNHEFVLVFNPITNQTKIVSKRTL